MKKKLIICHKEDYESLCNGEHLSWECDGYQIKIDNKIHQAEVIIYNDDGQERTVTLR